MVSEPLNAPLFERIAILGVGLMGGSLAVAAKRAGAVKTVVGWGRNPDNLTAAQQQGYIDEWTLDFSEAVSSVDVVVVATPTQLAEDLMVDAIAKVPATTIVTDVASVKANLVRTIEQALGELPPNVVLGHPIAGSEKSGVSAVDAQLYDRHKVILIRHNNDSAINAIAALWESVGAEVSYMTATQHDAVLSLTSHLPHLLSFALVEQIANSDLEQDVFAYAAGGLRDFSRVAGSDPEMWVQILLANRDQVLAGLDGYNRQLDELRAAIEAGDSKSLRATFAHAREHRNRFAEAYEVRSARK